MKRKQLLLASALLVGVTLLSCKTDKVDSNKEDNNGKPGEKNTVTYTIDGGSFHHQLITKNFDPKSTEIGAMASTTSDRLLIYLDDAPANDDDEKWAIVIAFNHAGTGTAKVYDPLPRSGNEEEGQVGFSLRLQENGHSNFLSHSVTTPAQTPGTITVTKFGPVGGTVEGNFQGKLKSLDGTIYTISGGHFVANRGA